MPNDRGTEKEDIVCVCVCVCVYIYIYTHMLWNVTQPSKKWNRTIYSDIDGTRGYYAKQNNSIRERELSFEFTGM